MKYNRHKCLYAISLIVIVEIKKETVEKGLINLSFGISPSSMH